MKPVSQHDREFPGALNSAYVLLANFSNETLTISKATVLGAAEVVSESLIYRINANGESNTNMPTTPTRKKKNEALYNKLLHEKLDHLKRRERRHIEPVLLRYSHVFQDEEFNDFKETNVIGHQILVVDAKPIRRPTYRTSYALRLETQAQVQNMLKKGIKGLQFSFVSPRNFGTQEKPRRNTES